MRWVLRWSFIWADVGGFGVIDFFGGVFGWEDEDFFFGELFLVRVIFLGVF